MNEELNKFLEISTLIKVPKGFFIYFLFNGDSLVYIGKSTSLLTRIGTHTTDKAFDSVKYISVEKEEQDKLELALIKTFKPKYNTQKVSPINIEEKDLLIKYSIKDAIINAIVRSLPVYRRTNFKFGVCAFFDDNGILSLGLLDDTASDLDDDDHDEACEYIEKKISLDEQGIEITEEIDAQLIESCNCEKAVVYTGSWDEGYILMDFDELHDLSGCEEMEKSIIEFESKIFNGMRPEIIESLGY